MSQAEQDGAEVLLYQRILAAVAGRMSVAAIAAQERLTAAEVGFMLEFRDIGPSAWRRRLARAGIDLRGRIN
jgi:hypothetical protein